MDVCRAEMTPTETDRIREALSHASVLCKQRSAIDKLRRDNEDLKEELLLENKLSVRPTKQTTATHIVKLQNESDAFTRKIELEKRRIGFLELKADDVKQKIHSMRNDMGGTSAPRDTERSLQKQVKILENRLEKAYRSYGEGVTKNRQLRESIDSYRRERLMLDNINMGLEKENEKMKKEMTKIIKNTQSLHEHREGTLAEITAIKGRTEKVQRSYEREWSELGQIIEEDQEEQERKRLDEMEERERKTQELLSCSLKSEKKERTNTKPFGKQAQAQNEALEKVERYNANFEKIRKATGIDDVEEVIQQISKAEDNNYTLFNFANELDTEIEKLKAKIVALKNSLRENNCVAAHSDGSPDQLTTTSEENALLLVSSHIEANESETKEDLTAIILQGTQSLIELFDERLQFELTAGEDISVENVEQILGRIEAFVMSTIDAEVGDRVQDMTHRSTSTKISIQPPSTQMEDKDARETELFDDDKPAFGKMLRLNVARLMECKSRPSTIEVKSTPKSARRRG